MCIRDRPYWEFFPSKSNVYKTLPHAYRTRGVLFTNVVNDGVIRINDANKVLILEHDTFSSITSDQNGGCVIFDTGHSIYQKGICAQNVSSSVKANYCYINILQTSENVNYHSMISITDCTHNLVTDMFWTAGGKTSLSYYNSTNNYVYNSPGFYIENSVGRANTSFINILSGTAELNYIVCSISDCLIQYSNFYKNTIIEADNYLIYLDKDASSVEHCVFAQNIAHYFLFKQVPISSCSFSENSFSLIPSSIPYVGSHSFIVNTQCHLLEHNNCIKKYSCVCRYFAINSFMLSCVIVVFLI